MATGFQRVVEHLQQTSGGFTDGQLLGRFLATQDQASFAALVRRHGPMVLGVCRRILRDFHDAEDAFQATFFVLARKGASVVQRESVGCWLYQVAYHTALEAKEANARRRARERFMNDMPHREAVPVEAQDWQPLLDRELSRLPEKYRAAIVLCDLEGRTRKEAARLLKVPEGTLSSRLATGRQMLAKRLASCGVALSGGALAVALSQSTASAQVAASLVNLTTKAAALVAAGQVAAVSTPAVLLMKGVMKAMLLKKLRVVIGAVMVMVALGAVGLGYQAGSGSGAAQAAPPDRPLNDLEALRRENDLLKLNLEVVLEKVRAQETELRGLRKEKASRAVKGYKVGFLDFDNDGDGFADVLVANGNLFRNNGDGTFTDVAAEVVLKGKGWGGDAVKEAEGALKALKEAKDKDGRKRATDALEKALQKLKQQGKAEQPPGSVDPEKPQGK